ncbi:unnamed protein product, partial [Thlaspi arvense]
CGGINAASPPPLQQLNIITAIKEAGNLKSQSVAAFQELLDNKKEIRRQRRRHTYHTLMSLPNSFAAYFVDYLLHPRQTSPHLTIYGSGQAKGYVHHHHHFPSSFTSAK